MQIFKSALNLQTYFIVVLVNIWWWS